ncbi:LPS export ABC transporter permease LptF [Salinisphaera sp.]|uniref:LPS export ABC transporter permease LptF n=1 Tax=Salinisphaera sp. TaxID=1914330 RepID=UPI000C3C221C|nr:LPS export ABC transporter permease LptF [Salinisphaera sp.]MBS63853.1 LPS export ABC transporter permease LptF [Salinisphaera sp.]
MIGIIFRYLFAEVGRTWLVVAGVLVFLTLGLGFARYIADAAAGELPVNTVLELAFFKLVENLEIVLPVSMLLGVLLTFGRLCRDNELSALFAGGAGLRTVYKPFVVLALAVATFAGVMSVIAAPHAERAMARVGAEGATTVLQTLEPGRFRTFLDGDAVFYAESRDGDDNLRDVFIRVVRESSQGKPTQTIVTAERARQQVDDDSGAVTLILDNGWRYEGNPGEANYRVIQFAEHGVQLSPPTGSASDKVATRSTLALMNSDDPKATAEWQKRLSVPLSVLILTLIAMPLGRVPPRAGRYGRVIAGVLVYVIYINAVHLAAVAIEDGTIPAVIGVWWIHLIALAAGLALIAREQGVFARRRAVAGAGA